ncbi:MAG: hypothetical protein PVF43_15275, partial [Candidatus Eiseniibacteriota bacterium]
MKTETLVWTILFLLGGLYLVYRAAFTEPGMGKAYVRAVEREFAQVDVPPELGGGPGERQWIDTRSDAALDYDLTSVPAERRRSWTRYDEVSQREYAEAEASDPGQSEIRFSFARTLGLWVAAFFTLAIFSFLYKDNPFYKLAESCVVGVSAGYWMVVGFWDVIVPNLLGKLLPGIIKAWAMPGLSAHAEWLYLVPLVLGIMLLWRLMPTGTWISRWPMAFIIGVFCGLRLISFLHADFLSQIRNSIQPLWIVGDDGQFMFWDSVRSLLLVTGVLASLVYFFFSIEHRGLVGKTARYGIWVLMITFGAAFGYTVMGRIALLAIRLEFLFDDWLWLIDPTGRRVAETASL